ncbi:MAG: FAD-dependent oxidoreductase [Lachnospiraceae bacterium]|nr:FAD-dependent oxidoreductase [Lachnospiraceae bacterium]
MSRLTLSTQNQVESTLEGIYNYMEHHLKFSPQDTCPIDITGAFLRLYMTQSCGKCTSCRSGLPQLSYLLDSVLQEKATLETVDEIERLADIITESADCVIGSEAAKMVAKAIKGFRDDFVSHIENHVCLAERTDSIPCVAHCPAHVNIPGYIALVNDERYEDAVKLITNDNPFPVVCALICEHPCEARCRRSLLDAPVNIRGLKRTAIEKATRVIPPERLPETGKKIAVVGGGPSGLTVAFYLQLMGHQVTVFERHKQLGGMLVYGIPAYRLPRNYLKRDIEAILSTGVEAKLNTNVGVGEYSIDNLRKQYDAVYVSIGAHQAKDIGIEGEDAEGVISAVDFLGKIGDEEMVDFTGKNVCVVGGGNVAMDCTRSAIRCGAKSVSIIYRRRREDMTALPEEIEGAIAEGAHLIDLHAPLKIETDENNKVVAFWARPNMVSKIKHGRMNPVDSGMDDVRFECDVVIKAIGQGTDTSGFDETGIPLERGLIKADNVTSIDEIPGVFAGGDCVTGPKTAILAIAAGKVAAANIDEYLGYHHVVQRDIEIPEVELKNREYCGRVEMSERLPEERKHDFLLMEKAMTDKEAKQEAGRCLRCDHFNCGIIKGGRKAW